MNGLSIESAETVGGRSESAALAPSTERKTGGLRKLSGAVRGSPNNGERTRLHLDVVESELLRIRCWRFEHSRAQIGLSNPIT